MRSHPLLKWSGAWGDFAMSGPNCNNWWSCWKNEPALDVEKRNASYEAAVRLQTTRINKLLPKAVVIKHKTKKRRKAMRKVSLTANRENLRISTTRRSGPCRARRDTCRATRAKSE